MVHCPKYIDYTRECINEIFSIPADTQEYCTSEKYLECPFFIIIEKTRPVCENIRNCPAFKNFQIGDFESFIKVVNAYCLSDNRVNCKRYILKASGKAVPITLHPDGRSITEWEKKI